MTTTDDPSVEPASEETGDGAASPHDEVGRIPLGRNPSHFGIDPGEPWPDDVPMDQDDTHWRFENNPRGARFAELKIAFCWGLTLLASIALMIVYVEGAQNQAAGACFAIAFFGLGMGMILWARDLVPGHDIIASRGHHYVSDGPDRTAATESMWSRMEPMARRPFLYRMLGAVGAVFGLALAFPLASLGPRPHRDLYRTFWAAGVRAVTEDGIPLKPSDIPVNGIVTVFPEGHLDDALSPTLLINVGDAPFIVVPGRENWTIGARLVAFSKICTHAGCPASLYNANTEQLICPCHQSTFDILKACEPVFGPASRPLPQLAIMTNADGYVVAQGGYTQPVGPGFWNRA